MADIAFLLLIFFLVTTTIDSDMGLLVRLPEYWEDFRDIPPINDRNILEVLINRYDELLVEGVPADIRELKSITREFIDNNGLRTCAYCSGAGLPEWSDHPDAAVVSLQHDRATSYDMYISVYNEIQAAYNELRNNAALWRYKRPYADLHGEQKEVIRQLYKIRISEAEPVVYGDE